MEGHGSHTNGKKCACCFTKRILNMEKGFITEMLAMLLHEMKNPVCAIIGFADLLKEEGTGEEEKAFFTNMIKQAGEQLDDRLNGLIDYCRYGDERRVEKQFFDLNKTMDRLYCSFRTLAESKGLIFTYRKDNLQPDSFIYTDEKKLKQVFENLLSNALKYTEAGTVEFGYKTKDDKQLEFYVRDTGLGIREDETKKIFGMYYRSPDAIRKKIDGKGIGLAIVALQTQQLGGNVTLETEYGKGSCFRFTLDKI